MYMKFEKHYEINNFASTIIGNVFLCCSFYIYIFYVIIIFVLIINTM